MPIKFTYLCDLLEALENLEVAHRDVYILNRRERQRAILQDWFRRHRRAIDDPENDRVALLSCLFPERRTDRVYNIQAQALLNILSRCLGLGRSRLNELLSWKTTTSDDLASWTSKIVRATDLSGAPSRFTIEDIDGTLGAVATQCRFSSPAVRAQKKHTAETPTHLLVGPVIRQLPSRELKWFIRLILKELSPVVLDEIFILKLVHPLLPRLLKFQSTFEAAVKLIESPVLATLAATVDDEGNARLTTPVRAAALRPVIGTKIGRPTFIKARSIKHCVQTVGNGRWAIEPKYDGEYCQVHIDLSKGTKSIQLFAKSGKDATRDREGLHDWIHKCLRLGSSDCRFMRSCILEGEMVVYSDLEHRILPFHKIRKHVTRSGSSLGTELDSQAHPHERLILVFYDALLVDDEVTMALPYCKRRQRLTELLQPMEGLSNRSNWGQVDFSKLRTEKAIRLLQRKLSEAISGRCEGLILKSDDSPYFSLDVSAGNAGKIVKLKKDYIPGLGDTADFAVIGATRDLRTAATSLSKNKWTHFIVACLENKSEVLRFQRRPKFKMLESLTRPCLSVHDMTYLTQRGSFVEERYSDVSSPSRFDVSRSPNVKIDVVFKQPFIVEILGSGFDKPSSCNHFMLRHPRITKVHGDRGLEDVTSFLELQEMAKDALAEPEDVVTEEKMWYERLKEHARGKRPLYACSRSPNSTTTTTSATTHMTTPSRPQRQNVPVLIRMDSQELLPGEQQMVLAESTSEATSTQSHKVPNTNIDCSLWTSQHQNSTRIFCEGNAQSRPLEAIEVNSDSRRSQVAISPTERGEVSYGSSQSNIRGGSAQQDDVKQARRSTSNQSPSRYEAIDISKRSQPKRAKTCHGELRTELHYTHATTSGTSPAECKCAANQEAQTCEVTSVASSFASYHTAPSACATDSQRCQIRASANQDAVAVTSYDHRKGDRSTPNPPILKATPSIEAVKGGPAYQLSTFTNTTIYLSPCVRSHIYLTHTLLSKVRPGHVTSSLSHWKRQLLHHDRGEIHAAGSLLPDVVGESQALAGLQKVVLIEPRRVQETSACIRRVADELDLAREVGEVVLFYDWRLVERVLDARYIPQEGAFALESPSESGRVGPAGVEDCFKASLVASVRWCADRNCNVVE